MVKFNAANKGTTSHSLETHHVKKYEYWRRPHISENFNRP